MKENLLLIVSILITNLGFTQTLDFTLANPQPNIMEAYGGTFTSGDVDGDGEGEDKDDEENDEENDEEEMKKKRKLRDKAEIVQEEGER